MNIKKVGKTIFIILAIFFILSFIYLAIPKYQIHSVMVSEDTVVVTKINTLNGQISFIYTNIKAKIWDTFE